MTDIDSIEQRLRRTFRVVAEQPIAPVGIEDEPWRTSVPPLPSRRRLRQVVGALAIIVVVALVGLVVAYGPRSSSNSPSSTPVTQSAQALHAVFVPTSPQPRAVLVQAATTMAARLHALGESDAAVTTNHGAIEVSGRTLNQAVLRLVRETGAFYVRPVLCGAPSYRPPTQGGTPPSGPLPMCQSQYALTAANLAVNTGTQQSANNTIMPDPSFAPYPDTSSAHDGPSATVLLPGDPAAGAQQYTRFVLGPAGLNGSDIATAYAQYDDATSSWIVDVTVKPDAVAQWNAIAEQSFHAYLGFDLDGQVLSAPLIQPLQTAFTSFGGQIQISANFTGTEAKGLAAVLGTGPMPVRLSLQSLTHTP